MDKNVDVDMADMDEDVTVVSKFEDPSNAQMNQMKAFLKIIAMRPCALLCVAAHI